MDKKFDRLLCAARAHAEFKLHFKQFCKMCAATLNNNEHIPAMSFAIGIDGSTAVLTMLDQEFIVRFRVVMPGDNPLAILGVYLPSHKGEVLLWHTFFDSLANIMTTPNSQSALHSLTDKEFLTHLVGECSDRYFSRAIDALK
jgi:hypothetical protein